MAKKVEQTVEVNEKNEALLKSYYTITRKSKKAPLLTKKQKKELGIGKDQGRASANFIRVPSRKANLVLNIIRGKELEQAYAVVKHTPRAACEYILKIMESAEANAVNNFGLDKEKLYVAEAFANQGPTLKRISQNARGSASKIRKRTSHITIVLKEKV